MAEQSLTEREARYLKQLQARPTSIRTRLLVWAIELTPSIGFFVYGLVSDLRAFLVLGFLNLLYFSVWRMYAQLRGAQMLKRIIETGAGASEPEDPRKTNASTDANIES